MRQTSSSCTEEHQAKGERVRILVGALHTAENEFEDCARSVRSQTHRDFEHFVFTGLGNVEADVALYGDFQAPLSPRQFTPSLSEFCEDVLAGVRLLWGR
jgi:hypothetical protein